MWRLTEGELRRRPDEVWGGVFGAGLTVAISRDGRHQVILTRTSVLVSDAITWDDYIARTLQEDYYALVAGGARIAATKGNQTIYMVPIGVMAPPSASASEIEQWVALIEDDWLVGPTFVATRESPPDEHNPIRIIELQL